MLLNGAQPSKMPGCLNLTTAISRNPKTQIKAIKSNVKNIK